MLLQQLRRQLSSYTRKAIRPPSLAELDRISLQLGLGATQSELETLLPVLVKFSESYNFVDKCPDAPPVNDSANRVARSVGYRPQAADNPGSAWYWRCDIVDQEVATNPQSKLAGRTVAVKDNICVAGVPMMNGSRLVEGFVPTEDATVVARVLQAGGRIVGKAACEDLCFSGASHTNNKAYVPNPHSSQHSSGGSSSGCGYLVATGNVDLAIGGDQGGSIRIPSSWCGAVGLKPTFGLVPYTGSFSMMTGIDHLGPMARSVADCALLLEVLAGSDGVDPRQPPGVKADAYSAAVAQGCQLSELNIGVLTEGFHGQDAEVDDAVRKLAERLKSAGANVRSVSLPLHHDAEHFYLPYLMHGFASTYATDGTIIGGRGAVSSTSAAAFFKGKKAAAADNQPVVKSCLLLAEYIAQNYGHSHFAKSSNWLLNLSNCYDALLQQHQLLLMPTLPVRPPALLPAEADDAAVVGHGLGMIANTAPFNATGHPALSLNCGFTSDDRLPIGAMLIGAKFNEAKLLTAAAAVERCIVEAAG